MFEGPHAQQYLIFLIIFGISMIPLSIIRNLILILICMSKLQVPDPKKFFKQTAFNIFRCWHWAWNYAWLLAGCLVFVISEFCRLIGIYSWWAWIRLIFVWFIPLFFMIASVASGVFIYFLNKKWTFSKTELTSEQKEKFCRYLAYLSFPHAIIPLLVIAYFVFLFLL